MRKALNVAWAILLMATCAWAATPWKTKPYKTWTKKEIAQIFNHSPWVGTAKVTAYWRPEKSTPVLKILPGSFPHMSRQPVPPTEIFVARWMSSLTMREAIARFSALKWKVGLPISPSNVLQGPSVYQIVVRASDMFPFAQLGEAGLAKATRLDLSGPKAQLAPAGVSFYRTMEGLVAAVTFTFPRRLDGRPTIPAGEKKIELVCKLKDVTVRFHFSPRRMTSLAGRDL